MHLQTLLLFPLGALALPAAQAPAELPRVTSIRYSGSGCPQSAPGASSSGGFPTSQFKFNNFKAQVPSGDTTTNCEVHMQTSGSTAGWQVAVESVQLKGHLVLDPGAEIDYYVQNYWSSDASNTALISGRVPNTGATRIDQDVVISDSSDASDLAWSPCGATGILNINLRVVLQSDGKQYGYFGKDADTTPTETLSYVWRQC